MTVGQPIVSAYPVSPLPTISPATAIAAATAHRSELPKREEQNPGDHNSKVRRTLDAVVQTGS